ncbi:unnamed protein product [Anisakis simplex]|uniref:Pre-rRNA-processing protein TSR1 homolog n=1 Tax=Anisakis simplex TaxID=6269 RepID=A0A158PP97_ANISI|nr:unnamed protein product [Anisakis simplex]
MGSEEGHRPGAFKQVNKKHKTGRHRTKGIIDGEARGRQNVKALSKCARVLHGKLVRRQQANQLRLNKRNAILAEKRGLGGDSQPPVLTTVLSLSPTYPAEELIGLLCGCDDTSVRFSVANPHLNSISVSRFKSRFMFLSANGKNVNEILDMIKVSDLIAFIWPLNGEITSEEDLLISCLLSHGLPTSLHFVPALNNLTTPKSKDSARKCVEKLITKWSFGEAKLLGCDNDSDGLLALRLMSNIKKKAMVIQKRRAHILVEDAEPVDVVGDHCTLKITGYIRGPSLNVNRLVHIPEWGDFQLKQVDVLSDPYPLHANKKQKGVSSDGSIEEEIPRRSIKPDPSKQASLQSEIIPDPMNVDEQAWSHEFKLPKDVFEPNKTTKKVPAGTSAYQAEWILDDDDEISDNESGEGDSKCDDARESDCTSDEEEHETMIEDANDEQLSSNENDIAETASIADEVDANLMETAEDKEIDMDAVEKYRKERENVQFPDEIDTPVDAPARIRFQKYRGLKSFRTSPWDPAENLPSTYARIFKFADYRHSKKLALSEIEDDNYCVQHGAYAQLFISNVPLRLIEEQKKKSSVLIMYALLPHEQQMSVMNVVLKKHPSCKHPILNKQKLIFHIGYRRFEVKPIFSQHTNGDKFKMERFMPSHGAFVASFIAPIMYPPAPVLVFREDTKQFVASGGVLNINPDRIILKRVVLSGHPFKILRRHAVVRYMFFNREDIEWFKPVELYTPRGRRGHIREAVGTHGHMKCTFDQQLNAMETVLMNLYKRVFPKWTYNALINSDKSVVNDERMEL